MKNIDIHTHIFNFNHIPSNFLPFGLQKIVENSIGYSIVSFISKRIIPWKGDIFDRVAKFLEFSKVKSQEQVYNELISINSSLENLALTVLSMDFEYTGMKKPKISFLEQIEELHQLKLKYQDRIFPFVMADPRRNDILQLVKKCIEEYKFTGVKLYPPLGYTINDFDDEFLKYLEDNQIPIITHCSQNAATHLEKDVDKRIKKCCHYPELILKYKHESLQKKCDIFSNPDEYLIALRKFPKLRIDFAHMGGNDEWERRMEDEHPTWSDKIFEMCKNYENVYTDISYVMSETDRHFELLKCILKYPHLRNKLLYGTDQYLVELDEYKLNNFPKDFKNNVGNIVFSEMMNNNARFLNL